MELNSPGNNNSKGGESSSTNVDEEVETCPEALPDVAPESLLAVPALAALLLVLLLFSLRGLSLQPRPGSFPSFKVGSLNKSCHLCHGSFCDTVTSGSQGRLFRAIKTSLLCRAGESGVQALQPQGRGDLASQGHKELFMLVDLHLRFCPLLVPAEGRSALPHISSF